MRSFLIASEKPETSFRRLLIAQDTGSRDYRPGARRYLFSGMATRLRSIAGRIKQFWTVCHAGAAVGGGQRRVGNQGVPLPKQRPKDIVQLAN